MVPETILEGEWFSKLAELDAQIADGVAAQGCQHCGGPLHRSDYERKPRGGVMAFAGEAFRLRHSLCCGREGCRRRALPPSLRFLGRRVYLEVVVLLATVRAMVTPVVRQARAETGVPVRTLRRWGSWWREVFPLSALWTVLRAQFVPPPPDDETLPKSLLERLMATVEGEETGSEALVLAARLLAPMTTESVSDGSRFVHVALAK